MRVTIRVGVGSSFGVGVDLSGHFHRCRGILGVSATPAT